MEEEDCPQNHAQVVFTDPQMTFRAGQKLRLEQAIFPPVEQEGLLGVEDIRYWQGAVLILNTLAQGASHVFGSAALVAPGIAVTAAHVIHEHQALGHFDEGAMYAVGPGMDCTHAWWVSEIKFSEGGEIAVLILQYAAELPDQLTIHHFATSARLPAVGERVSAVGFRPLGDTGEANREENRIDPTNGAYLASSGPVTDVWGEGRDQMLPRPCFAAQLTTVGAMSGGPVLNSEGKMIGIVSSSIDPFEDQPAITFSTMIWDGLFMNVVPTWPPHGYWTPDPAPLGRSIEVEESWRLHWSQEDRQFRYQVNGDRPDPNLLASFKPLAPLK